MKPATDRLSADVHPRCGAPPTDPAAAPLIRFEAVTKRVGNAVAVDGLDLGISEGEFFCLLGPSGCGKTTLMRLLAGFEQPDAGRVLLAGQDLTGLPPHRRPVNMMFQSYALFPHLSVAGNIAFGLKQDRLSKAEIAARVDEMLRLVQLEGLGHRRPDQLSGGQRQRVALARALAKRPRVLLLDEPLAALDKKLRRETQFELKELQGRLGTTFLVVTHDQEEAMTMADRIAVMDRGRLVQVAPPPEIYERPASRFVAGFIGDVNLFEGRVVGGEAGLWSVAVAALPVAVAVFGPEHRLSPGQDVCVAVRPEKIAIHRAPPSEQQNAFAGTVSDIGYLGDWSVYRVRLASGTVVTAAQPNATRFVEGGIRAGEPLVLSFAPEAALLLTR